MSKPEDFSEKASEPMRRLFSFAKYGFAAKVGEADE